MKKSLFFFAFFVALCSCKSVKLQPLRTQTTTTISDSTATKLIPRDTLLVFPEEELNFSARFRDLLNGQKTARKGNLTATLTRKGDSVACNCKTAELHRIIELQDRLLEVYQTIETQTKEETTITETKMPGWAKIPVYVGCAVILLAFVGLFMYIRSMPKRILKNTLNNT